MARDLITLGLGLVALAGCAEAAPPTLADGSLEAALPAAIWPVDPGVVTAVACPDLDADLIVQTTICTAVLDRDEVTVDVAIDELGAATASIREPLFVLADAADVLVGQLRADLSIQEIEATCDGAVIVAEPGRTLDCEATHDDRVIPFALVLGDENGDWTLRLAD